MKLKKGFELRDVCGEKVIIASGIENVDFSKMISLNESAAYLWKALEAIARDFTVDEAAGLLCKEYVVSPEQARKDVDELFAEWVKQGIVEV